MVKAVDDDNALCLSLAASISKNILFFYFFDRLAMPQLRNAREESGS
jgi:hypothetical protein